MTYMYAGKQYIVVAIGGVDADAGASRSRCPEAV